MWWAAKHGMQRTQPGSVGLELDIEISVLRVGDLQRGRIRGVIQQVLWNMATIQRYPHLAGHFKMADC